MALNSKERYFGTGFSSNTKTVAVGIDQSLTGFALSIISVDNPNEHETWVVKSPYNGVQRLNHLQSWIKTKLASIGDLHIVDVAMEGTVLASHSALVLGELAAAVKLFFLTYDPLFLPLQIPPMTLKKFASGKGTSKKQEMLLQIYKRWGIEFSDDNAADAYALARLASGKFIDDVEKSIIEQVKDAKYRDVIQ